MFILDILAKIAFFASLIAMLVIFYRKAGLLANLPKTTPVFEARKKILPDLLEKAKDLPFLKDFSFEMALQKILSRFRVFALKIENKTSRWLEALRAKAQREKTQGKDSDKYWENLGEKKEK
jgi:adenylate kinase family enzyme